MCVKCKTEHEQIKILNLLNAIAIEKYKKGFKYFIFLKKKHNFKIEMCVFIEHRGASFKST